MELTSSDNPQYQITLRTEGQIANEIMKTVKKLGLPIKLDELTEGLGNCFPIAIIQQCKRPEIFNKLKLLMKMQLRHHKTHTLLRLGVKHFMTKAEHPNVARFKARHEELKLGKSKET